MEESFFNLMITGVPYGVAALLLRLTIALGLLPFGLKKFSERKTETKFPAVLGFSSKTSFFFAMLIELVVPVCLIFGFWTRIAVLPAIFSMSVAAHVSKGPFFCTPALVFVLGLISILIVGPGEYSLDFLM